jgi:hypothetical protein
MMIASVCGGREGDLSVWQFYSLMITANLRRIDVVGQAFASAGARTARGMVRFGDWHCALLPWALMVQAGEAAWIMATGGDAVGCGTGRIVASHASAGCLKDGIAGFCGRGTSLTGSVLRMAAVWCIEAVDGPGDPPA